METPHEKAWMEERNRRILARTAGIVSWLVAAERAIVGLGVLQDPRGRTFGALCLAHAVLLIAAGAALFKDLRWAWGPALLAAGGATAFAVWGGLRGIWVNVAVDAAYAALTAAAILKRRHSA